MAYRIGDELILGTALPETAAPIAVLTRMSTGLVKTIGVDTEAKAGSTNLITSDAAFNIVGKVVEIVQEGQPHASTTVYGIVKIGSGINVADGVISVDAGAVEHASTTVYGIVKIGTGITVVDGVISADTAVHASNSVYGVVKIGAGITVVDGLISVPKASTSIYGIVRVGSGINVTVDGTISVPAATFATKLVHGIVQIGDNIDVTGGLISVPLASTTVFGVVKIGTGINVAAGVISVPAAAPAGLDTQVQFNDGGVMGASPLLTFIKATGLLSATTLKGTNLIAGRLALVGAGSIISDDPDFTFSGDTLTATKLNTTFIPAGSVVIKSATELSFDSDLTFAGATLTATNITVPTTITNTALGGGGNRMVTVNNTGVYFASPISGVTGLTAPRVPFFNGTILVDDADMTFVTDTLTVTNITVPTNITNTALGGGGTRMVTVNNAGLLVAAPMPSGALNLLVNRIPWADTITTLAGNGPFWDAGLQYLGIGSAPTEVLDVTGSSAVSINARVLNTGAGHAQYILQRTGTIPVAWSMYVPSGSTNIQWISGGSNKMFLTAASQLGIGGPSTNSAHRLHVEGGAGDIYARILNTGTGAVGLLIDATGGTASTWKIWTPSGADDLRLFSGADRFVFTLANQLLIGGTTSLQVGQATGSLQITGSGTISPSMTIRRYGNNPSGTVFTMGKSRAATISTFGLVLDDDTVAVHEFAVDNGVDMTSKVAAMVAAVDGVASATSTPGRLEWWTTGVGSVASTRRMYLDSVGNLGIGSAPQYDFDIRKNNGASPLVSRLRTEGSGDVIFYLYRTGPIASSWNMYLSTADSHLTFGNGNTPSITARATLTTTGLWTAADLQATNLNTVGRVIFTGAAGLLTTDADLTFSGSVLTATNITLTTGAGTGNRMVIANATGVLSTQTIPTGLPVLAVNRIPYYQTTTTLNNGPSWVPSVAGSVDGELTVGTIVVTAFPVGRVVYTVTGGQLNTSPDFGWTDLTDTMFAANVDVATQLKVFALGGGGLRMATVDNDGIIGASAAVTGVITGNVAAGRIPYAVTPNDLADGPFWISASHRLLLGSGTSLVVGSATARLQVMGLTADESSISIRRYTASTGVGVIILGKSRAAALNTNSIVLTNDGLGQIDFAGDDGVKLSTRGASIVAFVDAAPALDRIPGRLEFYTGDTAAGGNIKRMVIDSAGNVIIGGVATAGAEHRFQVYGSTTNVYARFVNTSTGEVGIRIIRSGGTASDWLIYSASGSTDLRYYDGTLTRFYFTTNPRFGIGASPSYEVDVHSSGSPTLRLNQTSTGSAAIILSRAGTAIWNINIPSASGTTLTFTSGTTQMSLTTAGILTVAGLAGATNNRAVVVDTNGVLSATTGANMGGTVTAGRIAYAVTDNVLGDGPYWVNASGRLQLGTGTSIIVGQTNARFQIAGLSGDEASLSIRRYTTTGIPVLTMAKSRGATINTNGIVLNGDSLATIDFAGDDGVDLVTRAAAIVVSVDAAPSANVVPGRFDFQTASATGVMTTRLQLLSGGTSIFAGADHRVGIGAAPAAGFHLDIQSATTPALRVRQTGTGQSVIELSRAGGTASQWQIYLPVSTSTDLRFWWTGADKFTFSNAGLFTSANLTVTGLGGGGNRAMLVDNAGVVTAGPITSSGINGVLTPKMVPYASASGTIADMLVYYDSTNVRLGIGYSQFIPNPAYNLDIMRAGANLRILNTGASPNTAKLTWQWQNGGWDAKWNFYMDSTLNLLVSNSDDVTKFWFIQDPKFGIGGPPNEALEVYGNIRTNSLAGSGTRLVSADSNGTLVSTTPSGSYTPVSTNLTNCAVSSIGSWTYARVGNYVTMTGEFSVTITTPAVAATGFLSLPIASLFFSGQEGNGMGTNPNGFNCALYTDTAGDKIAFRFLTTQFGVSMVGSPQTFYCVYGFRVV